MGILSKTSRYVCRNNPLSMNPSLLKVSRMNPPSLLNVSRRGYIDDDNNLGLVLQCRDVNGVDRFALVSTEEGKNLSPKQVQVLYPPNVFSRIQNSMSCNGLLSLDYGNGDVVVWNPLTGYYLVLPRFTDYAVTSNHPVVTDHFVAYDASCFGFDPTFNDYKLLCFFVKCISGNMETYDRTHHAAVYSFKNDFWKELPDHQIDLPTLDHHSVYINGCHYWFMSSRVAPHILCYDFANEKEEFTFLPLPDVDVGSNLLEILEFDGLLCVVVYPMLGTEKRFQVWVMKNGSWVKEYSVNLWGANRPLGFWRKGRYMFFKGMNHELMVFDRVTGDLNNLCIYKNHYPDTRTIKLLYHLNNRLSLSDQVWSGVNFKQLRMEDGIQ